MQPSNLQKILEDKPDLLSSTTRDRVLKRLSDQGQDGSDLLVEAIEKFGNYAPDVMSGYIRFNAKKLFEVIKFFCYDDQVFRTKLMKLLFYADFKHFKENGVSITGLRYAHAYHGPVPDKFKTWLAAICEWETQIKCEEQSSGDYEGEVFTSNEPDPGVFSIPELETLAVVKNQFKKYSSKQIREFSHAEVGFQETANGNLISYKYAEALKI
jgi:uncharacterized phage-associated protein